MSRVGRRDITIPGGVKVEVVDGRTVKVEASGKSLEHAIPRRFKIEVSDNNISVVRPSDSAAHRSLHGTTRSLIQNMIIGLTEGFQKKLQIQGVGYKAQMKGKTLVLDIGFSHSVNYTPPEDVTIETSSPTEITVKGVDKQKVGEVAAEIRDNYPPEPYKGKGIRYEGEYVRQKQGKSIA
ncbi:MAG: 50S ribosomal protein L6 [Candidatus Omnitrophica bacterium]|nr:50S ribosomal protein L6 [Candidatus Omnitrophota bacterium]